MGVLLLARLTFPGGSLRALVLLAVAIFALAAGGGARTETDGTAQDLIGDILANDAIQTALPGAPPPREPDRHWEIDWPEWTGNLAEALMWTVIVILVGAALIYLAHEASFLRFGSGKRKPVPTGTLIDDASQHASGSPPFDEIDRLAAQGAYTEAVHLLWLRLIARLRERLSGGIAPALTGREIGTLPSLPAEQADDLRRLVRAVERGHFGGRALSHDDYLDARTRYDRLLASAEIAK